MEIGTRFLSVIIPKKYSTSHGRQLAKRQGIIWILCYLQPDEGIKVKQRRSCGIILFSCDSFSRLKRESAPHYAMDKFHVGRGHLA